MLTRLFGPSATIQGNTQIVVPIGKTRGQPHRRQIMVDRLVVLPQAGESEPPIVLGLGELRFQPYSLSKTTGGLGEFFPFSQDDPQVVPGLKRTRAQVQGLTIE